MSACTTYHRIVSGQASGLGAGLARGALSVLSVPYRLGSSLVEIVQSGQGGADVGIPVISIGNLTVGGTGKTPVVGMVVADLLERGRRPVILSRGYAAEDDGKNDEARVLRRQHPDVIHLQGKDRVALAHHAAVAQLGDAIVLDDGFQYHKLHRDLNVCLIDATAPFGYGDVLPRGLLREPLSGLYRARPVLITRAELAPPGRIDEIRAEVLRQNEHAKICVSEMKSTRIAGVDGTGTDSPSSLAGKRVAIASGIGNPASFAATVRLTGARVFGQIDRGDHHAWTDADVAELTALAKRQSCEFVVTTSKDAVKLERLDWPADAPALRVLEIEVAVTEGEDVWNELVTEALARGS